MKRTTTTFSGVFAFILIFLSIRASGQLNGNYTIDTFQVSSTTNFRTIKAAVDTVFKYGVSGPVTFSLASDIYYERIVIPGISGASAVNTITFESAAHNADSVIVSYVTGSEMLLLDSASYISFRNISFSMPVSLNVTGLNFIAGSSYDSIVSCKITGGGIGINTNFFNSTRGTGRNNVFFNNTITTSNYGIFIRGTNINTFTNGNTVSGNTINTTSSTSTSVFLYHSTNTLIVNNVILSSGTAISNQLSTYQKYYHNSISAVTLETVNGPGYVIFESESDYTTGLNNIIVSTGTGHAIRVYSAGIHNTWDYNLYNTKALNNFVFYNATPITYMTLSTWQATGQDAHSLVLNPGFVSSTDLRIASDRNNCKKTGIYLPVIATDKIGASRFNPPTIGAYELADTNDITIDAIVPVNGNILPGLQDLKVTVRNVGHNTVSSFDMIYTMNNGTPVSIAWTGTLAPCDTASVIFTGAKQINLTAADTLKVYASLPNGAIDRVLQNDTLQMVLYTALNGNYTIGLTGSNYPTFSEAVAELIRRGVSGPVSFFVKSGTYPEQIVIPKISGTSSVNTITFTSVVSNADSVTLGVNGTNNSTMVTLNEATYISFKYISVLTTGTGVNYAFRLLGSASYDSIVQCKISGQTYGIYALLAGGKRNVFGNNTIFNGLYGIYIGSGGTNPVVYADSNVIYGNSINNSTSYGLYINFCNNTDVFNNVIISNGEGLNNLGGSGQRFYHNSINAISNAVYVLYDNILWSYNSWFNNVITSVSSNVFYPGSILGGNNNWDYNIYYAYSSSGAIQGNLAFAARKAIMLDSHSVIMNPQFAGAANLRLGVACGVDGVPLASITRDVDGLLRSTPPTIGAYEYSGINNLAVTELLSPSFPVSGGSQDLVVKVKNVGKNTVTSFTITHTLKNGISASLPWTGTLDPCDSAIITFTGSNQLDIIDTVVYSGLIYSSLPNGFTDTNLKNDTLKVTLGTALAGTYTINSSLPTAGRNFNSFKEAASILRTAGVSDTVRFNVSSGLNYKEEPLTFTAIGGSAIYPILFKRNGPGVNPIIYGVNGSGVMDAVVTLMGVNNITFDGIDVADSLTNSNNIARMEYGFRIINSDIITGCSGITIKNSRITLNKTNTATIAILQSTLAIYGGVVPVLLSGSNHNNRFENLRIENSYNGILLNGSELFPDSNNIITSSIGDTTIIDSITGGLAGIQLINQNNPEISQCIIRNLSSAVTAVHGIYLNNTATTAAFGNAVIKNNRIFDIKTSSISTTASGGVHGIRVDLSPLASATVFNNVIYGLEKANLSVANANPLIRGISHCVSGNGSASYYNNTILVSSGSSVNVSSASLWKGGSGTTVIRNNVLINKSGNQSGVVKHHAMFINFGPFLSSDNLVWSDSTNGFIGKLGGVDYLLGAWKNMSGDASSISYYPKLLTSDYLRPDQSDSSCWALNGRGSHIDSTVMKSDINGIARPITPGSGVPDIGAYEFTPASVPPLAIANPAVPAQGITQIFTFGGTEVAKITWNTAIASVPASIAVRQYSGTPPPMTGGAHQYMYTYLSVVMPGNINPYDYKLVLNYKPQWIGTNPLEKDIRIVYKPSGNNWTPAFTNNYIDTTLKAITIENVTDTSVLFTGTDQFSPLPVKLISLSGSKTGADAILNWVTASEINSERFEIERSVNGKQFEHITGVKAAGNSSRLKSYVYTDVNPAKGASVIYYRLRMVDRDGKAAYSNTVNIKWDAEKAEIPVTVFPNPFTGETFVNLTLGEATIVNVTVTDLTGRMVSATSVNGHEGENTFRLDGSRFNSGIYFVNISYGGIRTVQKIIKQ